MKTNIIWILLAMVIMLSCAVSAITISTPVIAPATAYNANDLTCNVTALDDNNATMMIEWFWYNGTVQMKAGNKTIDNNTNTLIDTLSNTYTTKGDVWNCTLRAFNSSDWSGYNSSTITISNSVPVLTAFATNRTVYDSEAWSQQLTATDGDSDTLTWLVNTTTQVSIGASNGLLSNATMTAGVKSYKINVTDGTGLATEFFTLTVLATPTWSAISNYDATFSDSTITWVDLASYLAGNTSAMADVVWGVSSSAPTSINCVLIGSQAYIQVVSGAPAAGTCTFTAKESTHPTLTSSVVSIAITGSGSTEGSGNPYSPPPAYTPPAYVPPVEQPAAQAAVTPPVTTEPPKSNVLLIAALAIGGLLLFGTKKR